MMTIRGALIPLLLALVLGGSSTLALARSAPVMGGANQTAGVSGNMTQTLFNGKLRIRQLSLREAAPGEHFANLTPPGAGERAVILRMIVSNGTHRANHGYFNATFADADGITVTGNILDSGWDLQPGAAARIAIGFIVPKDFKPGKIVLIQSAESHPRAFRISIRPGDLPAPAAASGP